MAVKFPLEMKNGVMARNISEVKENFDIEKIVSYFLEGKLLTWLEVRYYEEEAEVIANLSKEEPELEKKLCEVFGVEFIASKVVNTEEMVKRNAKIAKLKQYTDNEEIIANIDFVAFDQEELADIYGIGAKKIYLCAGEFNIPKSKQNLEYIELGNAVVIGKKTLVLSETLTEDGVYHFTGDEPYTLYYTTTEYTNGNYPIVEKLIGYDEKKQKKDILWTASFEEKRKNSGKSICALAKSRNYLWVCYKYPNEKIELSKMDLYGKNEKIVATMQTSDWRIDLWANDVNAYIKIGDHLFQINSSNQLRDLGEFHNMYMGQVKITENYLAILLDNIYSGEVIIFDNDAEFYDEYPYKLRTIGESFLDDWREKITAFEIYDGKVSFLKYNTKNITEEQNSPTLCVLQREKNEWLEYLLPNEERFSSISGTNKNSIISYIQIARDKLFIRSGYEELMCCGEERSNEFSLFNIKTGERNVLHKENVVFSTVYHNTIAVKENYIYLQLRKDSFGTRRLLMSINCLNGKINVIAAKPRVCSVGLNL